MIEGPINDTFGQACASMTEAMRRVRECSTPSDVERLAAVIFQCKALEASALALATQIDFLEERKKKKP